MPRRFCLQKKQDGTLEPDPATLHGAIQEHNWLYPDDPIKVQLIKPGRLCMLDLTDDDIPVGSIEFVEASLSKITGITEHLPPICIPDQLIPYAGRRTDIVPAGAGLYQFLATAPQQRAFLKSATQLKCDFADIYSLDWPLPKDSLFFVSEVLDILSEWRVFVFRGQIQDIRCYSGDFWLMPDQHTIQDMVTTYTDSPESYTLDIAVTDRHESVPVEVHNFVSCGLYGFCGKNLIRMYEAGIRWEKQRLSNQKV